MGQDQSTPGQPTDSATAARPTAISRQKKAFGLLLRRLSENAGLTDEQNKTRDQIYQHVLSGDFDLALSVNRNLLQAVSDATITPDESTAPRSLESRVRNLIFGNRKGDASNLSPPVKSPDDQLATLALDRAVLLGMSGQPGEANALLDRLMDARGDDPGHHKAEEIFEAALGLAELAGNHARLAEVLTARIRFYYELAVSNGDENLLETALSALETREEAEGDPGALARHKAEMLAGYGKAHEKTELLAKAANLLDQEAKEHRSAGDMHGSYQLVLTALSAKIDLAKLVGDTQELARMANRLREMIDLPDTMISAAGRAEARQILGHCLWAQADIDGRIITLRKAFGYLEAAAKSFADLGQEAREMECLRDLAMAKLTAAEIMALDPETGESDLVLAKRYNAEAADLQAQLAARLGNEVR